MISLIRVCAVMMLLSQPAFAIDRGFFGGLKPETAERVLMSFWAPLFYVVSEKGGSVIASIQERKPYTSHLYKHAALLFIEEKEAWSYQRHLQKTSPERLGLKGTNLNRILVHLYQTRNEPPSNDKAKPDMVIVDTIQPIIPVIEVFFDEQQRPYVHELRGKKFIPAFMSRDGAIAFETTVGGSKKGKFSRRGVDFRSHLKFIESYVGTDTPVVTFANEAPKSMNLYVENSGK